MPAGTTVSSSTQGTISAMTDVPSPAESRTRMRRTVITSRSPYSRYPLGSLVGDSSPCSS